MMTVKLEVGKQYRMRNGEKCLVVDKVRDRFIAYNYKNMDTFGYGEDGLFAYDIDGKSSGVDIDIISEWTEPMTEKPPTKTLRDEFAIAALNGVISEGGMCKDDMYIEDFVEFSYQVADAMMKQREIKE